MAYTMLVSFIAYTRVPSVRLSASAAHIPPSTPFEDWAELNGINAPKLAVTDRAGLRGVIVLDAVQVEEELCCVPRRSCLDLAAVEGGESPCPSLVPTPLWSELRWYERLACWLLAEQQRGADSPVSGYIGYLPRSDSFVDSMLEWTEDELAELSYPPLAVSVREQKAELQDLHTALVGGRGGPLGSTVDVADLKWAMQLVLSRAFTSTIATPKELAKRAPPPPPPPPSPSAVAARMWLGSVPLIGNLVKEPPIPPPPPAIGAGLEMAMMPMLDAFNHASQASTECAQGALMRCHSLVHSHGIPECTLRMPSVQITVFALCTPCMCWHEATRNK